MSYNGYTNYETWAVCLWLDNEEPTYNAALALVEDAEVGDFSDGTLAEAFKEWVEDMVIPVGLEASLAFDLLRGAVSEVNWQEVALHYVEDNAEVTP